MSAHSSTPEVGKTYRDFDKLNASRKVTAVDGEIVFYDWRYAHYAPVPLQYHVAEFWRYTLPEDRPKVDHV